MRMLMRYQNPPQKSKGIISGALLQTFEEAFFRGVWTRHPKPCRVLGLGGSGSRSIQVTHIKGSTLKRVRIMMENQKDKNMRNSIETGMILWVFGSSIV